MAKIVINYNIKGTLELELNTLKEEINVKERQKYFKENMTKELTPVLKDYPKWHGYTPTFKITKAVITVKE